MNIETSNYIFHFSIYDVKTKMRSEVYKSTLTDKFYLDTFSDKNIQICFKKELFNEEDCYEYHNIIIDDFISNPEEYI